MDRAKQQHTSVAHHTASRTRIRLSRKRRNREEMQRIAEGLRKSAKFRSVEVHLGSGSIIVHHDAQSLPALTSVLEDLGIVLASATDLELPASTLAGAVRDLDRRLGLSTRPIFDLRNVVPAAFAGLALRQLLRHGMQIEAAPWYVLAYLAFESFDRLHRPSAKSRRSPIGPSP